MKLALLEGNRQRGGAPLLVAQVQVDDRRARLVRAARRLGDRFRGDGQVRVVVCRGDRPGDRTRDHGADHDILARLFALILRCTPSTYRTCPVQKSEAGESR
jgi:hypothetical protein